MERQIHSAKFLLQRLPVMNERNCDYEDNSTEPGLSPKIEYVFLLTSRFMKRSGKVVRRLAYPTPQTNLTVARCRVETRPFHGHPRITK
jgi:hypothetical protein